MRGAELGRSLQLLLARGASEDRLVERARALAGPGAPVYATLFRLLAHLNLGEAAARARWRRLAAHRARLTRKLGRDPGLRVALLDYLLNVSGELRNPKLIELGCFERTERLSACDALTGLYHQVFLRRALARELQRARRRATPLSLVMLDLDDFKRVNDTRGHPYGDRVLVRTARVLRRNLREFDLAARYGGEEFALLLPDTDRQGAFVVADRIRAAAESVLGRAGDGPRVTLSGGVASFPTDASNARELLRRSDNALYRAKAQGKNRIVLACSESRGAGACAAAGAWVSNPG